MKWFGSTAGAQDIGIFGSLYAGSPTYSQVISTIQSLPNWSTGWAVETINTWRPALEDMNAVCYVLSYGVSYLHEMGVAEYDAETVYYTNSFCSYGTSIYRSLVDTNLGNLPTDASKWTPLTVPTPVADTQVANKKYVDDAPGTVVQVVNTQTGAVATGSTAMPMDDSIPQITEGTEFMTLAITPKSATNKLKIDVIGYFTNSNNNQTVAALFQDSTAGALAAGFGNLDNGDGTPLRPIIFTHYMVAGTTSATTFRVRAGFNSTGGITFNGISSGRMLGGVCASSITITEVKA